jgi:hypothetical protein
MFQPNLRKLLGASHKIPVDPFNNADKLQLRAVPGPKPEQLVEQQPVLIYFPEDPS